MRKLLYLIGLIVLHLQCEAQAGNYIQIPAGDYHLGDTGSLDNPKRTVSIESFWIAKFELTNAEFEKFVQATCYKTLAERYHNAMVFEPGLAEFRWLQDSTAYWRFPNGVSRGGIEAKMNHPVTAFPIRMCWHIVPGQTVDCPLLTNGRWRQERVAKAIILQVSVKRIWVNMQMYGMEEII